MTFYLSELLSLQQKSKIQANSGQNLGIYKFFTCSPVQNKFLDEFNYSKESLIVGTGGKCSVHYCNEPFSTSTDCLVFYSKNRDVLNLKWLYYFLRDNPRILERGFHGSGLKHISRNFILGLKIDLPTLDIQNSIVSVLDKINSLEEKISLIIRKYDLLIKSQFIEMFVNKYPMINLSSICTIIMGQSPSGATYNQSGIGLPFYQGKIDFGDIYINSTSNYTSHPTKIAETGDILISVRAPVGSTNISICHCCIGRGLAAIRPNRNCSNAYYILYSLRYIEKEIENMGVGSTFKCISKNQIENLKICKAPYDYQIIFSDFANQIDKSKFRLKELQSKLETLYKSLLQKYFG